MATMVLVLNTESCVSGVLVRLAVLGAGSDAQRDSTRGGVVVVFAKRFAARGCAGLDAQRDKFLYVQDPIYIIVHLTHCISLDLPFTASPVYSLEPSWHR
jgi:hypothetical protein